MDIDPTLLNILACPQDHGSLLYIKGEAFYNPRLRRAYPIDKGIPVLLIDEAREVDDVEHENFVKKAEAEKG